MPIALEPGKRWPIVLDSDKGMNPEPTFYARALSMREQQRVADVIDGAKDKSKSNREVFNEHIECLKTVIIGWSNMLDANTGEMIQFSSWPPPRIGWKRQAVPSFTHKSQHNLHEFLLLPQAQQ